MFGLEPVKDAGRKRDSGRRPCRSGRTFQKRALDVAIAQVNAKTDLKIKVASIERSKHRRVVALTFAIKTQAVPRQRPNP